jgi:hypothetical protein
MLLQNATQVGVGSTAVEAAAWVILLGGLAITLLWARELFT